MLDILQLNDMLVPELRELAEKIGLKGYKRLNKQELIYKILDEQALSGNGGAKEEPKEKKEKPAEVSQHKKQHGRNSGNRIRSACDLESRGC